MEVYKNILGYNGDYKISNYGNVKSFKFGKEKVLKQGDDGQGYKTVRLTKDGVGKTIKVHKLVAIAFLNHKPDEYNTVIDHINNIRNDNRVENLQIISHRKNLSKDKLNKSSKYTGVYWNKARSKWMSRITINYELIYLGLYNNEKIAHAVYLYNLEQIKK